MQNQTYVPIRYTELLEDEDATTSAVYHQEDKDVASTFRVGCVEDEDVTKDILEDVAKETLEDVTKEVLEEKKKEPR